MLKLLRTPSPSEQPTRDDIPPAGGEAATSGSSSANPMRPPRDDLTPLAGLAVRGDPAAVRSLLVEVAGPMLRAVRKVLGAHHPDVDDVTQEAAVSFLGALPGFRGACTLTHFACRVAVLSALAARRRESYRAHYTPATDPLDGGEAAAHEGPSPLGAMIAARQRALLRLLLDEMSDSQSEVLVLHVVLGYTIDEIAGSTGAPIETVRSRLRLAKQALRRRVQGDAGLFEMLSQFDRASEEQP